MFSPSSIFTFTETPHHSKFFSGIICCPPWGSFVVLRSFAVQFGDHLRSGIICGLGIICGAVQTLSLVLSSIHFIFFSLLLVILFWLLSLDISPKSYSVAMSRLISKCHICMNNRLVSKLNIILKFPDCSFFLSPLRNRKKICGY